ncbi:MAG: hypothetical protein RL076_2292, partial [Chloroflexota bacterium]
WSHTPIRPDSDDPIRSGQLIQCDIIPDTTPAGTALNCEDTVAIADATLRAEIAALAPDLWQAIKARREYLRTAIGIAGQCPLCTSLAPARFGVGQGINHTARMGICPHTRRVVHVFRRLAHSTTRLPFPHRSG